MQNSLRKKVYDIVNEFEKVLPDAIKLIFMDMNKEEQKKVKRLVVVWRDRMILKEATLNAIDSFIYGYNDMLYMDKQEIKENLFSKIEAKKGNKNLKKEKRIIKDIEKSEWGSLKHEELIEVKKLIEEELQLNETKKSNLEEKNEEIETKINSLNYQIMEEKNNQINLNNEYITVNKNIDLISSNLNEIITFINKQKEIINNGSDKNLENSDINNFNFINNDFGSLNQNNDSEKNDFGILNQNNDSEKNDFALNGKDISSILNSLQDNNSFYWKNDEFDKL
jgi:hypothetical protein